MPISNAYAAFDIVVVPFPYADRLAEKRRPALVISNAALAAEGVIWLAMITSALHAAWASDVPVPAGAGLPAPSVVRPAKIATIDPMRIVRRLGALDRATAAQVAGRVAAFLG